MMAGIKISVFFLTIVTIRFIFIYINEIGDRKLNLMKELIDFTDFLRVYSCHMKMSIDEIILKYNFKSKEIKGIAERLLKEIKNIDERNIHDFSSFIEETAINKKDFNSVFLEITDFYGNTYSDLLDKKLSLIISEMDKIMREYQNDHKEKKNLNNKISILLGCLTAIILV